MPLPHQWAAPKIHILNRVKHMAWWNMFKFCNKETNIMSVPLMGSFSRSTKFVQFTLLTIFFWSYIIVYTCSPQKKQYIYIYIYIHYYYYYYYYHFFYFVIFFKFRIIMLLSYLYFCLTQRQKQVSTFNLVKCFQWKLVNTKRYWMEAGRVSNLIKNWEIFPDIGNLAKYK